MDEINQEDLKGLINTFVQIESGKKRYSGKVLSVGGGMMRLRLRSQTDKSQVIPIKIEEIDAVIYKTAHKNVGY